MNTSSKWLLSALLTVSIQSQAKDFLVRFHNVDNVKSLAAYGATVPVVDSLGIYKLEPFAPLETDSLLKSLKADPQIKWAQEDHPVSMRSTLPNDPSFASQWSLDNDSDTDINAPEAWDFGSGGKDGNGSDIVIAIVDGGVDASHQSLALNMWVNDGEIEGNGVDDDGNGYVDDYAGWNAYNNNGNVYGSRHGTHVAGIAAARGDDGLQVTGVNWDAKIMNIQGSSGTTSTVLSAYGYVLKQKQIWLESAGERGANVVVTNSSFGVDYANCENGSYPAWNDIYNEMGAVGILSAAATINNGINVDVRGDVPTGCSSPYIIAVTNTTRQGVKFDRAGFGSKNIDLGAPGTGILSTLPNNMEGSLTGTSMATPHVAGAVGFLHSIAPGNFLDHYESNPGEAVLELKQVLLDSVTPQNDLRDITVSGGRLNLHAATVKMIEDYR
ncbi:MAG: S8 family serine peptidase [Bdellovibrionales bacterium]